MRLPRAVVVLGAALAVAAACSSNGHGRAAPRRNPVASSAASPPAPPLASPPAGAPGHTVTLALTWDGAERSALVHVPAKPATSPPLVVVLHGARSTGALSDARFHFDPLSDRDGFVVAYPDGIDRRWNSSPTGGPDDLGFLFALVDRLQDRYHTDSRAVFVAGISSGAAMAYRLACERPDRIAAVGGVAGSPATCEPTQPVSVVHVHGLADRVVPFDASDVAGGLAAWRRTDVCPADAVVSKQGEVTHRAWGPCAAGTAVELYTIDSGRHQWPGSDPSPIPGADPPSPLLDATGAIWAFFAAHRR